MLYIFIIKYAVCYCQILVFSISPSLQAPHVYLNYPEVHVFPFELNVNGMIV